MAASETTPEFHLSQFGPGDRPSWIDDYNADMRIIDENIYRINDKIATMSLTYVTQSDAWSTYATKTEVSKLAKVFNYFKNTGPIVKTISNTNADENIVIKNSPYTGLGDNEKINLINPTTIEVRENGLYAVWGFFVISLAGGGAAMDGIPVSVYLSMYRNGNLSEVEHVNTTALRTTNKNPPDPRSEQSIIVPKTIVELPWNSQFKITLKTPQNYDGRQQATSKFYIMQSGIGVEKLS